MTLREALHLKPTFFGANYFDGDVSERTKLHQLILSGSHDQPPNLKKKKLSSKGTVDRSSWHARIRQEQAVLLQAIDVLQKAVQSGEIQGLVAQIYSAMYNRRLQRIMLAVAAKDISVATDATNEEAIRRFNTYARTLFGELDNELALSMLSSEYRKLADYSPKTIMGSKIKTELQLLLSAAQSGLVEKDLLSQDLLDHYAPFISAKVALITELIDMEREQSYNSQECESIMNQSLVKSGLAAGGWTAEVEGGRIIPTTQAHTKRILLPPDIVRTPSELLRLIIHEQEVHARRIHNGSRYPEIPVLAWGTSGYLLVEEGLGIFMESVAVQTAKNSSYYRARDRYMTAGLISGVDTNVPRSAPNTYEILWRIFALRSLSNGIILPDNIEDAKNTALKHVENAFRGFNGSVEGLYYPRLQIYYAGLVKNVEYFSQFRNEPIMFERAFMAKYDHSDEAERYIVWKLLGI